LAACQRERLRFLRFSFTQRTQRKRLRLNGNRALTAVLPGEPFPVSIGTKSIQIDQVNVRVIIKNKVARFLWFADATIDNGHC